MTYGIRIVGLTQVQRKLGQDFAPTIRAATQAIALEVQGEIAPYPPATIANSPSNPAGRWYERGYGPKWIRKDGTICGRKTSQMMNRGAGIVNGAGDKGWYIKSRGRIGWLIGNRATYSGRLHSDELQARWAAARGWVTDKMAIQHVIASGAAKRIIVQAIMAKLRKGR